MSQPRQFENFNAATMPLDGLRLIEASAGTGKTFSLAGLYLRLLLEKHLSVREILVMTFTRAATQELRERIRTRLTLAARIAADPDKADAGDPEQQFARELIERALQSRERDAVVRQLRHAAEQMDEATISTIHGFAQQAAAENAFDSGLPFDRGEQIDDRLVHQEASADYWRRQVLGQDEAPATAFLQLWGSAQALNKALDPLLQKPHLALAGPDDAAIDALTGKVRRLWQREGKELAAQLQQAADEDLLLKSGELYKSYQRVGDMAVLLQGLDAGLQGTADGHAALPGWIAKLQAQIKKTAIKKGFCPHQLPLAEGLAELQPLGRLAALRAALTAVRATARERKRERRQFSFSDMVLNLHEAITDPDSGKALADSLHRTWPWALVDEFQDTDPLQYAILQRIYRNRKRGGLLMIGDPKQAIYGFRGGDVFAYLQAAADAEARYSLDTNYRSTAGMLEAVASVFSAGGEDAFVVEGIRFQTVKPGRTDGDRVIRRDGKALTPMTLWHVDDTLNKSEAEAAFTHATVQQIHALLDGNTRVADGTEETPLRPADISVLVNTNQQAAAMQRALSQRGIAAVCLHQQSVFATEQAVDVLRLLRAAAAPGDEDAVRAALSTPLLGYRMGDLIRLGESESDWRTVVTRFQDAHERWRRHGVLAMLEPLLQDEAERILGYEDGERRMSNYLQLAELLEQASGEQFGFAGLLRWLQRSIEDPQRESDNDAEQLRLESDDALIRIATIHKVKGLQYRIVFLPFAPFVGTQGSPDRPPFAYHDAAGRACLDVGVIDAAKPAAIREDRAEGVRLLYVALTRAEQACYLPWGAVNTAQNGALAWLLHQADGARADTQVGGMKPPDWLTPKSTGQRLKAVAAAGAGSIAVTGLPAGLPAQTRVAAPPAPDGQARDDWPAPRTPWSVFSFSRLTRGASHASGLENAAGAEDEVPDERLSESVSEMIPLRGAAFGTAVHNILETADFAAWPAPEKALDARQRNAVAARLREVGIVVPEDRDGERLLEQIGSLVSRCLHTPIDGIGKLADTHPTQRRAEMEFFLGLGGSRASQLLQTLDAHGYAADLPEARGEAILNGLMHGFIDLTVEADGRYYVLDYKTNDLGPTRRDYQPDALRAAVRAAHYDLQYLIYSVALHRHLAQRLPGYDPGTHLGGVRYLFLRGMTGDDAGDGVFIDRPPLTLIDALDRLLSRREDTA